MGNKITILIIGAIFIILLVFASTLVTKYSNLKDIEGETYGDSSNRTNETEDEKINTDSVITESDENREEKEEEEKNMVLELTSENFENEVLKSEKTVLIDFYADWCGPCKMMAPVVEKIASENENLKVCKVNIDNEESLAISYRVMSIPTFLVIKNGEVVNRIVGAVDKSELENAIK